LIDQGQQFSQPSFRILFTTLDCNIGTSGGIYQGTGTFASPTTGLKIYNSGGVGLLEMWGSGTKQVYVHTTGALNAGSGAAALSSDGISMSVSSLYYPVRSYKFIEGASVLSYIFAYHDAGTENRLGLYAAPVSSTPTVLSIVIPSILFNIWELSCQESLCAPYCLLV
jgi:hypothetical protein